MVYLSALREYPFVQELKKGKLTRKSIMKFRENLNEFLKDNEFRVKTGIEKQKYTFNEALRLAEQLVEDKIKVKINYEKFINNNPMAWDLKRGKLTKKKIGEFLFSLRRVLQYDDFRETFGFEKGKKYSREELLSIAKEILKDKWNELYEKPEVKIKPIKEIPEEMINSFTREADTMASSVYKSDIRFGAFARNKQGNEEIIGFAAAQHYRNVLSITALFVDEEYRRFGIAQQLIYVIIREAKKRKLDGVDLAKSVDRTMALLKKLEAGWAGKKNPLLKFSFHYGDIQDGQHAWIRFRKKH